MGLNILSTYERFAAEGEGGGQTGSRGDFMLQSTSLDFILQSPSNIPRILQSNSDFIQQSPFSCFANMLQSNGDKILQSGGTDKIQITGYCTSNILTSGDRIRVTS
jgi:hypothetical protein